MRNLNRRPQKLSAYIFGGTENGYHEKVWRGNRGRRAEGKVDAPYYAFVTMPDNLAPLNAQPILLPKGKPTGIITVATGNPNDPYRAELYPAAVNEYTDASNDKRNFDVARSLAQENDPLAGAWGFQGAKVYPK